MLFKEVDETFEFDVSIATKRICNFVFDTIDVAFKQAVVSFNQGFAYCSGDVVMHWLEVWVVLVRGQPCQAIRAVADS